MFLFIFITCCNQKAAVIHKTSLPVGMCYRTKKKTIFYAMTKSLATPKLTLHAFMLSHCHERMMSFILCIQLGTTSIPAFILLFVHFRGTLRLLHPKMIHIAPRRVFVSSKHTLPIYVDCAKKITSTNKNIISLYFMNLKEVWVDQ
jgi:hypothetical protein